MIRDVTLTQGKVAAIDAIDFRRVMKHKWHAFKNSNRGWYARTKIDGKRVFMHNFIVGVKPVDHRDGNGLNNTRMNLRPATLSQNAQNRKRIEGGSSKYKGVYLFRPGVFRVLIRHQGKQRSLGFFKCERDAALAYDLAAKELHGEFARLNFPEAGYGVLEACVAPRDCPIHKHQIADLVGEGTISQRPENNPGDIDDPGPSDDGP